MARPDKTIQYKTREGESRHNNTTYDNKCQPVTIQANLRHAILYQIIHVKRIQSNTRQYMNNKDNTRQDHTKQDKEGHDKTRQDKTRQDNTNNDKTRQEDNL